MTNNRKIEARILAGRYQGSRVDISDESNTIHIGYELTNDVVLRIAANKGTNICIDISKEIPQLDVLEGSVEVLGQTLGRGASMLLPFYMPIRIGDEIIAFGQRDSLEWQRTAALIDAPKMKEQITDKDKLKTRPLINQVLDWLPQRNPILSHPILTICIIALFGSVIALRNFDIGAMIVGESTAVSFQTKLKEAGFEGLSTQLQGDTLLVKGFVDSSTQVRQLEKFAKNNVTPVKVQLSTGAEMAESVNNVMRIQGISGSTRYIGNKEVEVIASSLDSARLAKLELNAKRDVPGLKAVKFRQGVGESFAGFNGLAKATANPGKRISSLVAGESGYLVTADGGRYFIGALLPTGHRIMAIQNRQVMLEQNGTAVRWIF
jgi:type III secretion protein D